MKPCFLICCLSPVKKVTTIVFYFFIFSSYTVMADGNDIATDEKVIIPDGTIITKGDDWVVKPAKAVTSYERMQAELEAGMLSRAKKKLDVALVEDDEKDEKIRKLLIAKMVEAENLFNQYIVLKENSNGDMVKLQEAKQQLKKAIFIWRDNRLFRKEKAEIKEIISAVESGKYEKWHKRDKAEKEIKKLINEAKFCEVDSDCVRAGFGCPFSCGTTVSESMVEQIKSKVEAYNKDQEMMCMYDCYVPPSLKPMCIQNRCSLK